MSFGSAMVESKLDGSVSFVFLGLFLFRLNILSAIVEC